jgi:dTDP-4-amino-4,6-dideoxygalactose transaminase
MPTDITRTDLLTFSSTAPLDSVPLLDVGRENSSLEQEILAAITRVTRSGRFVLGPECEQLEQRVARLCGVKHAVGCASGTDALLLALMAVNVRPGDEVIVPSFTFFATASAVSRLGGIPVFVDIDPSTFNLDPEQVEAAVTSKTKAIIPVHLFGQAAYMDQLNEIGRRHKLAVVEDAAQAIRASVDGERVGSLGDVGCFSFYPTKNLGGFGDGGMLTTNSDELADQLRLLRVHGMRPRYYHEAVGINSRLDTIQAAVLNVKLPNLEAWTAARRRNAKRYQQLFHAAGLSKQIVVPQETTGTHVWNQFTIRVRNGQRDQLRAHLAAHNVGSEIYYPIPLHRQRCFASLPARSRELVETDRACEEVLSLPIFPMMTPPELQTVVFRIVEFFAQTAKLPSSVPHFQATMVNPSVQPL